MLPSETPWTWLYAWWFQ